MDTSMNTICTKQDDDIQTAMDTSTNHNADLQTAMDTSTNHNPDIQTATDTSTNHNADLQTATDTSIDKKNPEIDAATLTKQSLCKLPLWATIVSYIVGFLWVTCFVGKYDWMPDHGMITMFTGIFFLWAELALKSIPRPNKECWFWMACAIAIAIGMDIPRGMIEYKADTIEDHPMMEGWDYIALHCIAIYWILCRTGKLIDNKTGSMFILDGITGTIMAPFGGIPNRIKRIIYGIKEQNSTSGNLRSIGITILSIIFVIPVIALVIYLLGKADTTFGALSHNIISSFKFDSDTLARMICGVFVSSYFFSIMSSCVINKLPAFSGQKVRSTLESMRFLPAASSTIIYGIFIAIYLIFFGVQGSSRISALWGEIPGTLTAAEFARSGFFELCTVMAINFGLILAGSIFSKVPMRESRTIRTMAQILLSESILLAMTAASKLALYIDRFGFTTHRLLSFWGILALTCGCILSIVAIARNKSYFDKWIWFTVATFVPLCFF
ncbi:MAG: DUF4173 domain-containing protein [Proteobacteria bacterium]|nr:DUF4173 domain-containing protein [Pseudomonadota bacterium]